MQISYLSESVKLPFEINSLGSFILTYSFENSSIPNSSFSIFFDGNDTSYCLVSKVCQSCNNCLSWNMLEKKQTWNVSIFSHKKEQYINIKTVKIIQRNPLEK